MYVKVHYEPAGAQITVEEADDCTRLHVEAVGLVESAVGEALHAAGLGWTGTPGHVWLDIAALRAKAVRAAVADDWGDRFDKMIGYARAKGWIDDARESLAAHIEGLS